MAWAVRAPGHPAGSVGALAWVGTVRSVVPPAVGAVAAALGLAPPAPAGGGGLLQRALNMAGLGGLGGLMGGLKGE